MDIFNTLAFITKPDHVELPAEATLEAIKHWQNLTTARIVDRRSAIVNLKTLTHD